MAQQAVRKQDKSTNINMTQGNPTKLLLSFSLPLLLGNVLQQMYNMVDSMVVGNFAARPTQALAAVGASFPVIFLVTSLLMGIGQGATIIVSQFYGAGDRAGVKRTLDTTYIFLLVVSIPVTLLGLAVSRPILELLRVPPDTMEDAVTYLRIIFLGLFASFGYNINSGLMQGLGDSRRPLYFLAIATVINIVLDLLFVIVFRWDVMGVALATIIAQGISFFVGFVHILRNKDIADFSLRGIRFDWGIMRRAIRLGLPGGLTNMQFSLAIMLMTGLINSYGSTFMAGFSGASRIDTFAFMPLMSFTSAITTYVGQNVGARRLDRVKDGVRSVVRMALITSVGISVLLLPLSGSLMRLFNPDVEVIQAGVAYLVRLLPFYSLLAIMFMLNGAMRGAGQVMVPMISSIISLWLVRVPAAYLLAHYFGRNNLFFCFVAGWAVGLVITGSYYLSGRWMRRAQEAMNRSLTPEDAPPLAELDMPI